MQQQGQVSNVQYRQEQSRAGKPYEKVTFNIDSRAFTTTSNNVFGGNARLMDGMHVVIEERANGKYTNTIVHSAAAQNNFTNTNIAPKTFTSRKSFTAGATDDARQTSIEVQAAVKAAHNLFATALEHNVLPDGVTKKALSGKEGYATYIAVLEQISRDVYRMYQTIKNNPDASVPFPDGSSAGDSIGDDEIPF